MNVSLHRLDPDARWVAVMDRAYIAAAGRPADSPVDCAACGARHRRGALVQLQIPGTNPVQWLLAAVCPACGALDIEDIEAGMLRHRPLGRRVVARSDDGPVIFYVLDPDFGRDRAS
jgi:hypothetical protein